MTFHTKDLKPAGQFAGQYGVKAVVYGPPGSAKTPLINTAPNPVLLACEPGMLSMRGSNVPTCQAFTPGEINDFFAWFFGSNERRKFDTLAVDSVAQMADIYLQQALKNRAHGLQAYGEMAREVMNHLRPLFYTQGIHTYLICKLGTEIINGVTMARPYFPGNQLNVDVPHLYDEILYLAKQNVPGQGQLLAFRCQQSIDVMARDRTGKLNEYEPPNFGQLVAKCMG